MSPALSVREELPEVQCSDFTAKKEPSPQQPSHWHPVRTVQPSQHGRHCLHAIADPEKIAELLSTHELLLLCTFMGLYGYGHCADALMELRPAAVFVRASRTLLPVKGYMELLGLPSCISTRFRFISGRASKHLCPGFVEFKIGEDVIHGFAGQVRIDQADILFGGKVMVLFP